MNNKVMAVAALIGTIACIISAFLAISRGRNINAVMFFAAGLFCLGCTVKLIRSGTFK